jgi:hypothetical protein
VWDCVGEEMVTKGEFHIISGPIKDLAWDGESKRIIAVGDGKERYFLFPSRCPSGADKWKDSATA